MEHSANLSTRQLHNPAINSKVKLQKELMATTIKVVTTDTDHPIRWPSYCTQCGAKEGLVQVYTQATDVKTVKPWTLLFGVSHTEHYTLKLGFPVCKAHTAGLAPAQWITQNGGIPRIVRWAVYFFFIATLAGISIGLYSILFKAGVNPSSGAKAARLGPTNWGAVLSGLSTFLLPFAAAGYVLHAFRKVPLRLTRLEDDAVTIRFKVDRYARAFARSNQDIKL